MNILFCELKQLNPTISLVPYSGIFIYFTVVDNEFPTVVKSYCRELKTQLLNIHCKDVTSSVGNLRNSHYREQNTPPTKYWLLNNQLGIK